MSAKSEQRKNEKREDELVENLPAELDDNTERGERIVTGKTIAQGGQTPDDEKSVDERK